MKSYQKLLAVIALSGMCMATAMASEGEVSAKKSKKHHAEKTEEKAPCEACEAIKRLEEKVTAQQAEIDQLKGVKPAEAGTTDAAAEAAAAAAQQQAAAAAAAAADANAKAAAAQADVAGMKNEVDSAAAAAQQAQKEVGDLEHPASIAYKGIKLTPGGFAAAETLWRQHDETADIGSSFSGIPYTATNTYHLTEFRGTARQSRLSLLGEGKAGPAKLTGYYEMDFLGAAATANENQSNSWQPRIRQAFGKVSLHGWSVTAGQTWSLLTLNRKGAEARAEWVPATIDAQYSVGYTWARLMTVRVAKTFADDKATVAFSIENPATQFGGAAPSGVTILGSGAGSSQLGNGNNYSVNLAPDLIAKVAYDPSFGHFEIKAVGRFFRDRVGGTSGNEGTNYTTLGGGIGAGAIVPLMHKKVDVIAETLFGRGTGRYGDSLATDVTYRPNGSLAAVRNLQAVAGVETHFLPKLDWYVYGGEEYLGRDVYGANVSGYGLTNINNLNCFIPNSGSCSAVTKGLIQGNTGFWYNVYKGGYGTLRYGMQYSYTYKTAWRAVDGTSSTPNALGAPKTSESIVMTSIRYYLP
jgi:hypothetical protein